MHAGRAGGMVVLRRGAKDVRGPGGMWVRFAPRGQGRTRVGRAYVRLGPRAKDDRAGGAGKRARRVARERSGGAGQG